MTNDSPTAHHPVASGAVAPADHPQTGPASVAQLASRNFALDPNLMHLTVMHQAQGVHKALQELVQNSLDANATRVTLHIDESGFVFEDDGVGFPDNADEIHRVFGTFGTPHEEGDSRFGRFRIGRGQIMAYASTEWASGCFVMHVDLLRDGMQYTLERVPTAQRGCRITGTFYHDPYHARHGTLRSAGERLMTPSYLNTTLRELADCVRYADIPIVVNSRQINTPAAGERWDLSTSEAFYKFTRSGGVKVYNMGFYVRAYGAHELGNAIVVTRTHLALTLSRTDIYSERDPAWRAIKAELRSRMDARAEAATTSLRMEPHEQHHYALAFATGEMRLADVANLPILTDINGKACSLKKVVRHPSGIVAVAERGTQIAQTLHHNKACFCLASVSLERFGLTTLDDLLQVLRTRASEEHNWEFTTKVRRLQVGDLGALATLNNARLQVLDDGELTKTERLCLDALRAHMDILARAIAANLHKTTGEVPPRRLMAGDAAADGWTDGRSTIVLNRHLLPLLARGYAGAYTCVLVLAHEYCHDEPTGEQHIDDDTFYERFHTAVASYDDERTGPSIGAVIERVVATFTARLRTAGRSFGAAGRTLNHTHALHTLLQDLLTAMPAEEVAALGTPAMPSPAAAPHASISGSTEQAN